MKRVTRLVGFLFCLTFCLASFVSAERVWLSSDSVAPSDSFAEKNAFKATISPTITNNQSTSIYSCLTKPTLSADFQVTLGNNPEDCRSDDEMSTSETKQVTWTIEYIPHAYHEEPSFTATAWGCTLPTEVACTDQTCAVPTCNADIDCDDSNPCTTDACSDPSTCTASCTNTPKDCMTSCGTDLYCDGLGNCESKVTSGACAIGQCNSTWTEMTTETDGTCNYGLTFDSDCSYLTCTLNETSACTTNGCLCATDDYCDDGDACTIDSCVNPGADNAYCSHSPKDPLISGATSDGCCDASADETTDIDCASGSEDETYCAGEGYFNLQIDDEHCGSCNVNCTENSKSCCSGLCYNLTTDEDHCGDCTTVCPEGQFCSSGTCVTVSCATDADCDDGLNCTINTCANPGTASAQCTTSNRECGYSCDCDDENATCVCNGSGACTTQGISGASCVEQCFVAFVDSDTGICYYDVDFDEDCLYTSCVLGTDEICADFGCACTTNAACDDGNECTTDVCDNGICDYTAKTCGSTCASGVCIEGNCTTKGQKGESCLCESCAEGLTCQGGKCTKVAGCGNGECDPGECEKCSKDCLPTDCTGDGICSAAMKEDCTSAPKDCKCALGKCDPSSALADESGCVSSWCGDGVCDTTTKECGLCADDCTLEDCAGNGQCDILVGETCETSDDCNCNLELDAGKEQVDINAGERKTISFKVKNTGNKKQSLSVVLGGNIEVGWNDTTVELDAGEEAVMNVEVWSENGGLHYLEIGVEDEDNKTTRTAVPFTIEGGDKVEKARGAFEFILLIKDYIEFILLAAGALGSTVYYLRKKSQKPQDYRIQSSVNWTNPNGYSPSYPVAQQPPTLPSNSPDFPTFGKK